MLTPMSQTQWRWRRPLKLDARPGANKKSATANVGRNVKLMLVKRLHDSLLKNELAQKSTWV